MQIRQLRAGRPIRVIAVAVLVCAGFALPPLRAVFDVANGYLASLVIPYSGPVGDDLVAVTWESGEAAQDDDLRRVIAFLDAAGAAHVVPVAEDHLPGLEGLADVEITVPLTVVLSAAAPAEMAQDLARSGLAVARTPSREMAFAYYRPTGARPGMAEGGERWFDRAVTGDGIAIPEAYWVGYLPENGMVPTFDGTAVLRGYLPQQVFEEKIVVLALGGRGPGPRSGPGNGLTAGPVPAADFVVHALRALRDGRVAIALPDIIILGVIFLAAIEAGSFLARLRDRAGPLILPSSILAIAIAGAGALVSTGIMFPTAEAIASFALSWMTHRVIVDVNRRRRQQRHLRRLALLAAPKARAARSTPETWEAQIAETASSLGITRWSMFRHSLPSGYQPVAVSCDPFPGSEMKAMRRAASVLDRGTQARILTPFKTSALQASNEEAWAVAVRTGDLHASVWIVACPMGWLSSSPARRATLVSAMEQLLTAAPPNTSLRSRPTLDEEIWERTRELGEDAATLDLLGRLAASAFAIYDLTGRIIRQNERMRDIGREADLDVSGISLTEAIQGLTGLSGSSASEVVSTLVSTGEAQRIRLPEPIDFRHYDFNLSIAAQDPAIGNRAGRLGAILLELIDVTPSVRLSQDRENVAEFFDQQLRNDFEAVDLIVGMLTDGSLEHSVRLALAERLIKVKTRMLDRMQDFEVALKDAAGADFGQAVPTELRGPLDCAIDTIKPITAQQDVRIDYSAPNLLSLAFAASDELEAVFRDALEFCLSDTKRGKSIKVAVRETPVSIETLIESNGYGIPQEVLGQLEAGTSVAPASDLRAIQQSMGAVQAWGGSFSVRSELDCGTASKITLRKVR